MNRSSSRHTRIVAIALVAALVLGAWPATALAQSETTAGGTVTVGEGETVSELTTVAGTVVVADGGTVTGDVSALAGNVRVEEGGVVEGDLSAAAGNVEIAGRVDGDVSAAGGNVELAETGAIGGQLEVGAGSVLLAGSVGGDATVGAERIELAQTASLAGNLRYDGELVGATDVVSGQVIQDSSVGASVTPTIQPVASWLFALYALALNLLLGVVLLALFPRFSGEVGRRVASDPLRTGLVGLAVAVVVPILLVAIAITVVGIPVSLLGAVGFGFAVWVGVIYGRFAVAAWLLSRVGLENPWLALVVGLVGGALLARVPIVGGLLNAVIVLLGLGALAAGLYARRRRSRRSVTTTETGRRPEEPAPG